MLRKRTLYDIFKLKILLYFVVPIILMAIIIFANHRLNIDQYKNLYTDFYNNYTDKVFLDMDEDINTFEKMDYWLKTDAVRKVFNSNETISDADATAAIAQMQRLKNDFSIVDSVLVVNRKADIVISTDGNTGFEEYFNEINRYKAYDVEFFKDMRYPEDTMIKLPPTSITNANGETTYVMPVVKTASRSESPNSFFIFNISLDKFLESSVIANYTDNTSFWFVNKKDKQFYSGKQNSVAIDNKIWQQIDFDKKVQNYTDLAGNDYYVISRTISPNLMDYAYLVFIPTEDVNKAVSGVTLKIVIISILIYLLFAVIVLFLASNAGKVFVDLIKPLNFTEKVKVNEVFKVTDKISKEFSTIVNENTTMKMALKEMEGDVKEKMITDVLKNKQRQVRMSLYKYDGFIPVIFRILPEKTMRKKSVLAIREQLYEIVYKYLCGIYETYDISNLDGDMHFVLNVPRNLEISSLMNELEKLSEIISKQDLKVEFEYHIGDICDNFDKLKFEYTQLRDDYDGKAGLDDERMEVNKYIYRASEHNAIITSVLEGDHGKTMANIDRILIANAVNGVCGDNARLLYQNIVNTIVTALRMKKIDVDKLIENIGNDVYFNIDKLHETEISLFILELLKSIDDSQYKSDSELMSDIMRYVDNNYHDYSLSLESVAKKFEFDAKNLSKQFKKHNGIAFHKYLTELKIEEAKKLLLTSDLSIEQIYNRVGFISRTTFIRAFTSIEKVTPSEYRKNATK